VSQLAIPKQIKSVEHLFFIMELDPSRQNPASWSAKDYLGKSYLYTPEKMLTKLIEEDNDSTKPSTKRGATKTVSLGTGETSRPTKERTPLPNDPIRKPQSEAKSKGHRDKRPKPTPTKPPTKMG
jgi:hypothetical protein